MSRVAVLTGATSGIGVELARGLARHGDRVVVAVRDMARGRALAQEIGNAEVVKLDLLDLDDVRQAAREIGARHPAVDVLIANAGIYTNRRVLTPQGFESTFQVNHLGHFLLANLLRANLERASSARVVVTASAAHYRGAMAFDDLHGARRFSGIDAYTQSKLANVMFTRELARRLEGTRVTANAFHPGVVRTNWARQGRGLLQMGVRIAAPFMMAPRQGADTGLWLSTSHDVEGKTGGYYWRRKLREPQRTARDAEACLRLWEISEKLCALA